MKKIILLSSLLIGIRATSPAQYNWENTGSGSNLPVFAMAADTTNNVLYAGGVFTQAGGLPALGVAKWDGNSYSPLGSGLLTGVGINSLLVMPNGDLIAGGSFTNLGGILTKNIARWNGTSWASLGLGLYNLLGVSNIRAMAVYNNEIYAGGIFTLSGLTPLSNIAKWTGTSWVPVGTGVNGAVTAMAVYNGELYVGGSFTSAGGVPVHNIAKWTGTSWGDVGGGLNYTGAISVSALQVYSGGLYAGGTFTSAGSATVKNIAVWDGTGWSDPGGGADYTGAISVSSLQVFHGDLVAGGTFDTLGTTEAKFIGKWNGTYWSEMGGGMNGSVYALAALGDTLYAGGLFTKAGGNDAFHLAQWQPTAVRKVTSFNSSLSGPEKQFDVFPNPSRNNVWIRNNTKNLNCSFILTDALGREISSVKNINAVLNFERNGISAGLYFYKIMNAENAVLQEGKLLFTE
ncbi:MAG: T9SS type A sorting domain-containing protein [Bacteroidia bacterium]